MSDPNVLPDDQRDVDSRDVEPSIPLADDQRIVPDDERIVIDDDDELGRDDDEIDLSELP